MRKASWSVIKEYLSLKAEVQNTPQPPYVEQEWRLVVQQSARPEFQIYKASREDIITLRNFLTAVLADSED